MENVTTAINHTHGTNTITCTVLGVNDFGTAELSEYAKFVGVKNVNEYGNEHVNKYGDFASILEDANAGETITLLSDHTLESAVVLKDNVTLALGGNTLTGTVLGTVSVNNGLWITAEGLKLIGTGADYYSTTNAVVNVTASDITIASGNVGLAQSWRTLPGQNITVDTDATFTVPAGMTFTIYDNTSVTVNGTLVVAGQIVLNAGATLKAPAGLNVVTNATGCVVKYVD